MSPFRGRLSGKPLACQCLVSVPPKPKHKDTSGISLPLHDDDGTRPSPLKQDRLSIRPLFEISLCDLCDVRLSAVATVIRKWGDRRFVVIPNRDSRRAALSCGICVHCHSGKESAAGARSETLDAGEFYALRRKQILRKRRLRTQRNENPRSTNDGDARYRTKTGHAISHNYAD
jgi:hypothetical protein